MKTQPDEPPRRAGRIAEILFGDAGKRRSGASRPLDEVARAERAFDRFERVLRSASEPARQTFLEHCAAPGSRERSFAAAPSPAGTGSCRYAKSDCPEDRK
jgi:hypothetical protein